VGDLNSSNQTSRRKVMRHTMSLTQDARLIYELCEVKARPKTILHFIKFMDTPFSQGDIGRMYKEVHGEAPPRGMATHSVERSIGTAERRLHASYYGKKFAEIAKLGLTGARLHLRAYYFYLYEFEVNVDNAILSFEQAFQIIQGIQRADLEYTRCREKDCASHFLKVFGKYVSHNACPVCNLFRKRAKNAPDAETDLDQIDSRKH
jgi:hypothetical protein